MTYYRIGSMSISWGNEILRRDTIHNFPHRPETIKKLLELGRISIISGPPLSILDGFEDIYERLAEKEIFKAEHFLEATLEDVKPIFRKEETFQEKKQELIDKHLLIPIENRDCNC